MSMFVEGVGDEVVLCLVVFTGVCSFFLLLVKFLTFRSAVLHPDSADQVAAVRRERRGPNDAASSAGASPSPASRNGGQQDTRCPVCLDADMLHGVETNCGHRFCASCMLQYWRHDQWPRPARCPVCRRQVNLLLPLAGGNSDLPDNVQREVLDYNQRMAGEWRPILHYLYDVPVLLHHLWEELWSVRGPRLFWQLYLGYFIAAMILYLLSPLDIIPESVFGLFGLLDDVMLLLIMVLYVSQLYRALHIHR